jgi:hypothetical protein
MTNDDDRTAQQLAKLAEIEARAQQLVDAPHYHLHDGQPVADPATGEPLIDSEPVLRGLDVLLRAHELRANLLGLYAPQVQEIHLVDEDGNTLDITRLVQVLRKAGLVPEAEAGE